MATRHRFLVGGRERTVILDEVDGVLTATIDDNAPIALSASATGVT